MAIDRVLWPGRVSHQAMDSQDRCAACCQRRRGGWIHENNGFSQRHMVTVCYKKSSILVPVWFGPAGFGGKARAGRSRSISDIRVNWRGLDQGCSVPASRKTGYGSRRPRVKGRRLGLGAPCVAAGRGQGVDGGAVFEGRET